MISQIQPWHIAAAVLLLIALAVWRLLRRQRRNDGAGRGIGIVSEGHRDPLVGGDEDEGALPDALDEQEEEAPLVPLDRQRVPAQPAPRPEPERVVQAEMDFTPRPEWRPPLGRHLPDIDEAIDAVIWFWPADGTYFLPERLTPVVEAARAVDLPFPARAWFHEAESGLWYAEPERLSGPCDRFGLALQTADCSHGLDRLAISRFLAAAEQLAINLPAENVAPDGANVLAQAERVSELARRFTRFLIFKLVGPSDIDEQRLRQAAQACGMVLAEGYWELPAPGSRLILNRGSGLNNELQLSLSLPLADPSSQPLSRLLSLANDLSARLDLVLTDPMGAPIVSSSASLIARQLATYFRNMAANGMPAGTTRAERVFVTP